MMTIWMRIFKKWMKTGGLKPLITLAKPTTGSSMCARYVTKASCGLHFLSATESRSIPSVVTSVTWPLLRWISLGTDNIFYWNYLVKLIDFVVYGNVLCYVDWIVFIKLKKWQSTSTGTVPRYPNFFPQIRLASLIWILTKKMLIDNTELMELRRKVPVPVP